MQLLTAVKLWVKTERNVLKMSSYPVVLATCIEETYFPHWILMAFLMKISWPQTHGFISGLTSIPLIYMSVFMTVSHCLSYCTFVVSLKLGSECPPVMFFFKAIQRPMKFHMNFRMAFSVPARKKKKAGCPLKLAFQIDNKEYFSINMFRLLHGS